MFSSRIKFLRRVNVMTAKVNATDLNLWANRRNAQDQLPRVIRRLIHATIEHPKRVGLPADESVQLGGFDGIVEVSEGNPFVPDGLSVWELGATRDIKGKANGDYKKRSENPLGIVPNKTTFVFVTPRRWGTKDNWIEEKNNDGVWAEVRAYDADDLEQWLELAPAVHIWLTRLLGKWTKGTQDIEDFWEKWICSTEPSMNAALSLAGREKAVEQIKNWLNDEPSSLTIQSDSQEESIVFFVATLYNMPEEERIAYKARCVIVQDIDSWQHLVATNERLIIIPYFDNIDGVGKAVQQGHHVIVPVGKEISASKKALQLPRLEMKAMEKAIMEMGISKDRVHKLLQDSKRNILVLRRLLASTPEIHCPVWAKPENARSLVPFLLTGAWDDTNKIDCQFIEQIAQKSYKEILDTFSHWSNESDPPVRKIGNIFQLISREDSWHLLSRFVRQDDLDRFEKIVLSVLKTVDPRYELKPDERWAANIYDKTLPHSSFLKNGLVETLALLATREEKSELQNTLSTQDRANLIVRELFSEVTHWQLWASLSYLLPTLAEVAPDIFLDAVENALVGNEPVLLGIFAEEGPMGGSPHTGLLWALETLVWEPKYLSRTALILAKLARLEPGGKLMNRPHSSLYEIFLCWYPQTTATLEQRLKIIDVLIKREPDVAWTLLRNLLPNIGGGTAFPISRPKWREWGNNYNPKVTENQYRQNVDEIIKRLLTHVGSNSKRWCHVIEEIKVISPEYRVQAINKLLTININDIESENRIKIWECLRAVIHEHRNFAGADWALPSEVVDKLYLIYQKFQPSNLIDCYAWLFSYHPELPDVGKNWHVEEIEENIKLEQEAIEKAREKATEIYSVGGISTLLQLAKQIEQPQYIGLIMGQSAQASELEHQLLNSTLGQDDLKSVGLGFIDNRFKVAGWSWAEKMLSSDKTSQWSAQQRADFIRGLPFEKRAWQLLISCDNETETLYWKQFPSFACYVENKEDCEEAISKLMLYNRHYAALSFASSCLHKIKISARLLADILKQVATIKPNSDESPLNDYKIEQIFYALDNSNELEETDIAQLEWAYLPILTHRIRQPRLLHRELSNNPLFFAEVISFVSEFDEPKTEFSKEIANRAKFGYDLLRSWHQIPAFTDEGTVDLEQLKTWVIQAREACNSSGHAAIADQKIGEVLAYAPAAPNGVWPDVAVREVIEETASEEIEKGVHIAILNQRGVYTKSLGEGGKQERDLAKKYHNYAKAIMDEWPRTGALLLNIAKGYESDARREDIHTELHH